MIIKGSTEMGYPVEDLHYYFMYYLISDGKRVKEISPDFIPKNYFEYIKGVLGKAIIEKGYGKDIDEIFILLICRNGASNFKVRKRYYPADRDRNWIGIDCVLDVAKANLMTLQEEKIYLLQELKKTFTSIQTYKKKLKNFDFDAFEKDIQAFLDSEIKRIENEFS